MSFPSRFKETARKSTGMAAPRRMVLNTNVVTLDDDDDDESGDDYLSSESDTMDMLDRVAEKILAKRVVTQTEYRIKWKNCADTHNSWAPEEVLHQFPILIAEYEKKLKQDSESQKGEGSTVTGASTTESPKEDTAATGESASKKVKITAAEEIPPVQSSSGFDGNLTAEKIIAATRNGSSGEINFLVKWEDKSEATLVSAKVLNASYPQIVINFYEERLKVSPEQWITA